MCDLSVSTHTIIWNFKVIIELDSKPKILNQAGFITEIVAVSKVRLLTPLKKSRGA